jgi:hypothetical protein
MLTSNFVGEGAIKANYDGDFTSAFPLELLHTLLRWRSQCHARRLNRVGRIEGEQPCLGNVC